MINEQLIIDEDLKNKTDDKELDRMMIELKY